MGRIGVLATSVLGMHAAVLVSEWAAPGQATLFLNGAFEPDAEQLAELAARSIQLEREPVVAAEGAAPTIALRLRDGRARELDGLFVLPRTQINERSAKQLGCELDVGPTGSFYRTEPFKETTVPGATVPRAPCAVARPV